jgi:hypothetical protein
MSFFLTALSLALVVGTLRGLALAAERPDPRARAAGRQRGLQRTPAAREWPPIPSTAIGAATRRRWAWRGCSASASSGDHPPEASEAVAVVAADPGHRVVGIALVAPRHSCGLEMQGRVR